MSIFSDHDCGAMSDDEFRSACAQMNAQDRAERERLYECEEDENCGDCILYETDACTYAGCAVNDEPCEYFIRAESEG